MPDSILSSMTCVMSVAEAIVVQSNHPSNQSRLQRTGRQFFALLSVLGLLLVLCPMVRAADRPRDGGDAKAARALGRELGEERAKWEARIAFYGEEDTGEWSLRIMDKDVTEAAKVDYIALWQYDVNQKKWVKLDAGSRTATIRLHQDKPPTAPPDSQIVAELPLKPNEVGLYYATWRVNESIDGASFCKIGPGLIGQAAKDAKDHPLKPPPKFIVAIVPLTASKAEAQIIPDPRYATVQVQDETPQKRK